MASASQLIEGGGRKGVRNDGEVERKQKERNSQYEVGEDEDGVVKPVEDRLVR